MIYVYNRTKESHNENNFYIGRGSIFGNPYTDIKDKKTKARYVVKDRETAIHCYSHYFDLKYKSNEEFRITVDYMYELYKSGTDIYLECYCKPLPCHGDIIKEKLEKRLLKEKINKIKDDEKQKMG